MDRVERTDAVGFRREEGRPGDKDRGKTDQRVEGRDELRHLRHGDAPCDHGANTAADHETAHDESPSERILRLQERERRHDGDGHADHAERVALARGLRRGEAAKREDEENCRREVQQGRYIG